MIGEDVVGTVLARAAEIRRVNRLPPERSVVIEVQFNRELWTEQHIRSLRAQLCEHYVELEEA